MPTVQMITCWVDGQQVLPPSLKDAIKSRAGRAANEKGEIPSKCLLDVMGSQSVADAFLETLCGEDSSTE